VQKTACSQQKNVIVLKVKAITEPTRKEKEEKSSAQNDQENFLQYDMHDSKLLCFK
jgi:hypothetical protein